MKFGPEASNPEILRLLLINSKQQPVKHQTFHHNDFLAHRFQLQYTSQPIIRRYGY